MIKAKTLFILFILATCFISCGSFGEGLLMGLSSIGNYATYPSYGSTYQTNNTYTPSSTTSGNNLDYLIDPNYTVAQYNSQLDQEFNQFSLFNKKPDGTNYTKDEWMNLRAQACSEMNKQENSTSRTDTKKPEVKKEQKKRPKTYYEEHYGMKTCYMCKGTGKCATCNGRGYNENGYGSTGYHECPNCLLDNNLKPTGICRKCRGKGEIYGLLH